VRKYLAMCLIMKCCWMYSLSCPPSSHQAPVSAFGGQQLDNVGRDSQCQIRLSSSEVIALPVSLRLTALARARNILHIERAREWKRARVACRLAFSPYGRPCGCYTARPQSKGPPTRPSESEARSF
jgi:hypothetical protein